MIQNTKPNNLSIILYLGKPLLVIPVGSSRQKKLGETKCIEVIHSIKVIAQYAKDNQDNLFAEKLELGKGKFDKFDNPLKLSVLEAFAVIKYFEDIKFFVSGLNDLDINSVNSFL